MNYTVNYLPRNSDRVRTEIHELIKLTGRQAHAVQPTLHRVEEILSAASKEIVNHWIQTVLPGEQMIEPEVLPMRWAHFSPG